MTESSTERAEMDGTAAHMAIEICRGFKHHDDGDRRAAVESFAAVDELQFAHLDGDDAREAAEAYVDALWAKDAVEEPFTTDGEIDQAGLAGADWGEVEAAFMRRADVVNMNPRYAEKSTVAWRNHKVGGDYWTPIEEAQMYEIRAAIDDPAYPHKPRYGRSGFGAEPVRYALAVELHDMHTDDHWQQAAEVMQPYFEFILRQH